MRQPSGKRPGDPAAVALGRKGGLKGGQGLDRRGSAKKGGDSLGRRRRRRGGASEAKEGLF